MWSDNIKKKPKSRPATESWFNSIIRIMHTNNRKKKENNISQLDHTMIQIFI